MANDKSKSGLYVLIATIVLFIVFRLIGSSLFDNNWSFNHWRYLPTIYPIIWIIGFAVVAWVLWKFQDTIAGIFSSPLRVGIGLAILLLVTWFFRFDSFVYGSGNLRVSQIAQVDVVILRWFEYGTILLTSWLYNFFLLFVDTSVPNAGNIAGVMAWQTLSFGCVALSMIASVMLARDLFEEAAQRLLAFFVVFFGAQALLNFGFIGVEPVVVPVTLWFAVFAWRAVEQKSKAAMGMALLVALVGLFMHATLVFLVPAAVFVVIVSFVKRRTMAMVAFGVALIVVWRLIALVYGFAGESLEFAKYVLFVDGKLPFSNYGIFSVKHVGDYVQLFFLAAPLVVAFKMISFLSLRSMKISNALMTAGLMSIGGAVVMLILDPLQGVVLDTPRLIAYLAPFSFFFVVQIREIYPRVAKPKLWLAVVAAASIMLPLSFAPSYTSIDKSQEFVTDYLDKHDVLYRSGCISYRDAYFYKKEFTTADDWEWKLPTHSPDYLNLRGTANLIADGEINEAIRVLQAMVVRHPYWTDPRMTLAAAQLQQGWFNLAKPHIDTCLMLEPYRVEHRIHLYSYQRNSGNVPLALRTVKETHELFPGNVEVNTDLMLLSYRSGDIETADSLANYLVQEDSTLAFPNLMLGLLEDMRKNQKAAIPYFKKFVEFAPNEVETPAIQQLLDSLVLIYPDPGPQ